MNSSFLKFRVWNKETNKWLSEQPGTHCFSEYYVDLHGGGLVCFIGSFGAFDNSFSKSITDYYLKEGKVIKESPYVIQRFTGKHDNRGQEIYEGDILYYRHKFEHGDLYENSAPVVFDEEIAAFTFDEFSWLDSNVLWDSIRVVGNIFENSEFLR